MLDTTGASWTDVREQLFRKMWTDGVLGKDMAEAFGCSADAIRRRAAKLRLPPRPAKAPFWTRERQELFRQYWAAGETFKQIGARFGCSRSAASAAASRMGLQRISQQAVRERLARVKHNTRNAVGFVKNRKPPQIFEQPIPTTINPKYKSLLELKWGDGLCRFPFGEEKFTFCALPCEGESSWCPFHQKIVWRPRNETTA